MEIWKKLLTENTRLPSRSSEKIWTYSNNDFNHYSDTNILKFDKMDAVIVSNDLFESMEFDEYLFVTIVFDSFYFVYRQDLDKEVLFFLKNYWTLITYIKINKTEKPFIFVHMASSLDGKISTVNGDSKWIGNEENLIHAHRLRAIVDGVLIGANTVECDGPKLNVRHVEGENPIRMVLSNNCNDFSKLESINGINTYLLRGQKYKVKCNYTFDETIFFDGETEESRLTDLLIKVRDIGIKSILIEGGATTVSSFVKAGLVDIFQLHMAPIILGSGRSFIQLPEIPKLSDSISMKNISYSQMGDSMMITGRI